MKKFISFLVIFSLTFSTIPLYKKMLLYFQAKDSFYFAENGIVLETGLLILMFFLVILTGKSFSIFSENTRKKSYLNFFYLISILLLVFNILILWNPFFFKMFSHYLNTFKIGTLIWILLTSIYSSKLKSDQT